MVIAQQCKVGDDSNIAGNVVIWEMSLEQHRIDSDFLGIISQINELKLCVGLY